jgi:flagellar protein FliS
VHPRDQYLEQQVATATPAELILMLYNGAITRTTSAIETLDGGDVTAARPALIRAQDIVMELRCSLDHTVGGEIARNLDRLYDFAWGRLMVASTRADAGAAREAVDVLVTLRDAWREACVTPVVAAAAVAS